MKTNQDTIPEGYVRVTSVLGRYTDFSHINPDVLANAADRGSRAHNFCELHALGLFVSDVDEDCKGYFESFCRWHEESVEDVIRTEDRLNSEILKLSGKFDMIAVIKGDKQGSIIDIKTPASASPTWQLQTAAYQILCNHVYIGSQDWLKTRRLCIMLDKNGGKAKIVEHTEHAYDQELFMSALSLYHFFK